MIKKLKKSLILLYIISCSHHSQKLSEPLLVKPTPVWDYKIVSIPNFSNCNNENDKNLYVNPKIATTILIHGCNPENGQFFALSKEFEKKKQQTICFHYNDRDNLEESANTLVTSILALDKILENKQLTLLSHSQGSLVTRRAMTKERSQNLNNSFFNIRLVTLSAPFGGISAAKHCTYKALHVATLGISAAVCWLIAGSKWSQIHYKALFITEPGELSSRVQRHLKIDTNEENTCRYYGENGKCQKSDFVFSINEQKQVVVDSQLNIKNLTIPAGHVEIIGTYDTPPPKLLMVLQNENILAKELPPKNYFNDKIAKAEIIKSNPDIIWLW